MSTYEPREGDRVRAHRYQQPTLTPGDPQRVKVGEWTGTALPRGNGMLTDDGPARSTYLSFDNVRLGRAGFGVTEAEPERAPEPRTRGRKR